MEADPLTKSAFLREIARLKTGKACGPDGVPAEVFINCDAATSAHFDIMCKMWELEYVPTKLVCAAFIMGRSSEGEI